MNIKIIETEITKAMESVKCVSNSKAFREGVTNTAHEFGLEVVDSDIDGVAISLYDPKNNTRINFMNSFVDKNLIDYKNNNEKEINIREVFEGYDMLPTKNKKSINLITFETGNPDEEAEGLMGASSLLNTTYNETHTIRLPHYLLNKENRDKYEYTMAHESMHCFDYVKFNQNTHDRLVRLMRGEVNGYDDLKFAVKYNNINSSESGVKFKKTYGVFAKAKAQNLEMLKQLTSLTDAEANAMNASSAYGFTQGESEDFAEAGAMVILGHNNIDNPKAVADYGVTKMPYREWAVFHTYQIQTLRKELYGEKLSPTDVASEVV